jgi:hypothetical protein
MAVGGSAAQSQESAMPAASFAPPLIPTGRPLAVVARRPVQWVSPFLVLAQMTTGRQAWWFLLALVPLVAAAWLSRRTGMGWIAPWSRP